jgi:hypothetical protein
MYLALMIVLSVGVSVGLAASSRNDQSFENRVEVLKVQFLACSMTNWVDVFPSWIFLVCDTVACQGLPYILLCSNLMEYFASLSSYHVRNYDGSRCFFHRRDTL